MKTLKIISYTFLLSLFIYSCTPEDDEGLQTTTIEDTQATGDNYANISNGSKE